MALATQTFGGDFITSSLKTLPQDCVLLFTYMNVEGHELGTYQARIHTGFHHFPENGQKCQNIKRINK